jgi:hypothetical protein
VYISNDVRVHYCLRACVCACVVRHCMRVLCMRERAYISACVSTLSSAVRVHHHTHTHTHPCMEHITLLFLCSCVLSCCFAIVAQRCTNQHTAAKQNTGAHSSTQQHTRTAQNKERTAMAAKSKGLKKVGDVCV